MRCAKVSRPSALKKIDMFEQERTLNRLQQRVGLIPGLTAAFLVGSRGGRGAHADADFDVVMVYRSLTGKEAARYSWPTMAAELLPYVAAIVHQAASNPDHLIALFANGAKFDLYFYAEEEVSPHPRFQSIRILHDTASWAQDLTSRSAALTLIERPVISDQQLADLDRQFWTGIWEVARLTRRGEVDRPFPIFVDLLNKAIAPLLAVLPADAPVAQALAEINFSRQPVDNRAMVQQLIPRYQAARSAVVENLQLSFQPHEAVERELVKLI